MILQDLYKRVADWNAARYDRVYNHDLACNLIIEEMQEYWDAVEQVDQLDAICDIAYVALGAIWKCDETESTLASSFETAITILDELPIHMLMPITLVSAVYVDWRHNATVRNTASLFLIFMLCMEQAKFLGLTQDEIAAAMHVVCDSNDSKSIKKVAPDVKANAGDKGENFIDPEPRLLAILEVANARHH